MLLYAIMIISAVSSIAVVNINNIALGVSNWQMVLMVGLGIIGAFLIDLVIAIIVSCMPKKWFNPDKRYLKIFAWERKIYETIGIKRWKSWVPANIRFKKDKIYDAKNNEYVLLFMQESAIAEVLHFWSMLLGFLILIIFPVKFCLTIMLPIAMTNVVLQLLPIFIQRYNRPKLMTLYCRNAIMLDRKNLK